MSILTIYRSHLSPERNALVDHIDWYLENEAIELFKFNKFQYQKLALEKTIVVPIEQAELTTQDVGNYLTIQQDNETWYYFIMSYAWTSVNSLTLVLSLDTVHTLRDKVEWSAKTTITRQHEDRFFETDNYFLQRNVDEMLEGFELSKYKSSDITLQQTDDELDWFLIYKTTEEISPNTAYPFDCFLCANKALSIGYVEGEPAEEITHSDLENGKYEYVFSDDNPNATFTASVLVDTQFNVYETRELAIGKKVIIVNEILSSGRVVGYRYYESYVKNIVFYPQNGRVYLAVGFASTPVFLGVNDNFGNTGYQNFNVQDYEGFVINYTTIHTGVFGSGLAPVLADDAFPLGRAIVDEFTVVNLNKTKQTDNKYPTEDVYTGKSPSVEKTYGIGSISVSTIDEIGKINKTDTKLMKIIRLPYCPVNVVKLGEGLYSIPTGWNFAYSDNVGLLKLSVAALSDEFISYVANVDVNKYLTYSPPITDKLSNRPVNEEAESKLFSSEFLTLKFIYDSFAADFKPEQFKPVSGTFVDYWSLPILFKQTNTVNSHFLFDLGYNQLGASNPQMNLIYKQFEDYEQYLVINRNNEETLFNSDYLNYLRNGYNYDKKVAGQQTAMTWLSTALQVGGSIVAGVFSSRYKKGSITTTETVSFGQGSPMTPAYYLAQPGGTKTTTTKFDTSGKAIAQASAISLATSAAVSIANAISSTISTYNAIAQKKFELSQQAVSVSGSDDIDLLKYYNDNRLHFVEYKPIEVQKKAVLQLFHRCGYGRGFQGIPNFTGRYWFNYIQCSPMFKNEQTHPYFAFLTDLKARYEAGITVYHRHYNAAGAGQSYD